MMCAGGLGSQFLYNSVCRELNCVYSQVLRRRQWTDRKITGKTTSVVAVSLRLQFLSRAYIGTPWGVYIFLRDAYSRQMIDNIFEIETIALAHVACAPVISLTDLGAAYPSVNHFWIVHVLEKTELPDLICRFFRRIYCDSTTFSGISQK